MATSNVTQPFDCFSTLVDRHGGPAASFLETEEYKKSWLATKSGRKSLDGRGGSKTFFLAF